MNNYNDYYYSLSLDEINRINNKEEKEFILNLYKKELKQLAIDRLSKKIINNNIGKSIKEITYKLESIYYDNTSIYTFPSDIVLFYPSLKEYRASKNMICHVTGSEIKKGSFYYSYRALLENISNNHIYVLDKTIRAENTEIAFFPTTISEFDNLKEKIDTAYSLSQEEYDYYGISRRIGGSLKLRKLR